MGRIIVPAFSDGSGHVVANGDDGDCHMRSIATVIPRSLQLRFISGTQTAAWPRCSHLTHSTFLVASYCAHSNLVQNQPSFPTISSLSHPTWISPISSQLCLCPRSKHLPSGAQTFLPFIPAHSWDDGTRELISTTLFHCSLLLGTCAVSVDVLVATQARNPFRAVHFIDGHRERINP